MKSSDEKKAKAQEIQRIFWVVRRLEPAIKPPGTGACNAATKALVLILNEPDHGRGFSYLNGSGKKGSGD